MLAYPLRITKSRLGLLIAPPVIGLLAATLLAFLVSPQSWPPLKASIQLASIAAIGSLPLGFALGFLLARTDIYGRRFLTALTAAMMFAPLYLQAAAWEAGFGRLGWYTLMNDQMAAPLLTSWRAASWVHVVAAIPWVAMIVAAGLRYVDADQEDAATLDGGFGGAMRTVTLPYAAAPLGVAAIWVFVTTAAEMTVADLFFISTFARELYNSFGLGDHLSKVWFDALPGLAMTASLACAAACCLATVAPRGVQQSLKPAATIPLGGWRWPATLAAFALVLAFTAAPMISLCVKAGWVAEVAATDRARSWSLLRFLTTVGASPWRFRTELGWSIAIGALAATLAVVIAAPLAFFGRRGGLRAAPLLATSAICVATPGPLLGLLMVTMLSQDLGPINQLYDRTLFAPVLATAFRAFPFVGAILWLGFRSINDQVLDSSRLDGASGLGVLLRVAAPLRGSLLAAAWLVAFAIASGDLAATILVAPPGVTTAAVRVFGLIHSGVRYQESGLCLASLGVYVAAAAAAMRCFRRSGW